MPKPIVNIIGGGPAGLMAAEVIAKAGVQVHVYESQRSVARKFLMAGKGGLNLTHSEDAKGFRQRYGNRADEVGQWLDGFDAQALRDWAQGLGIETFVGSSGRVFPIEKKAAPLLRAWVRRLKEGGVVFHVQHKWQGWDADGALRFLTPEGDVVCKSAATVLALGGGSWPQLGSDGAWQVLLQEKGVEVLPLQSANCGFDVGWSDYFLQKFAGTPLKAVVAHWQDSQGVGQWLQGECVVTATGVEGSLIYALSAMLRDRLAAGEAAGLYIDLAPGRELARLSTDLAKPRGGRSLGEHLRRNTGLDAVKVALLYEVLDRNHFEDTVLWANTIKRLPVALLRPRPLAEAISSAGGVSFNAVDEGLMLASLPGTFCAGEMLDWEAPTGGYLLTACFASGLRAGKAVVIWLENNKATLSS